MVEVLYKVHNCLAHIGRQKLVAVVLKQFWHPAMLNIAKEICKVCDYCQKNKTNIQYETPPTLRVQTEDLSK